MKYIKLIPQEENCYISFEYLLSSRNTFDVEIDMESHGTGVIDAVNYYTSFT